MEINLPEGWKIKKLVHHIPIIKTGVREYKGEKFYFSTGSVSNGQILPEGKFSFEKRPARANRLAIKDDVLQARMQETKKALLIDEKFDGSLFSTGFLQFRPSESNYDSRLFHHYLCSDLFLKQRDEFASGSTQVALTDDGAENIDLIIPPQDQHKNIADKLDILLEKVKDCQTRLDKIPLLLKRFRESVLTMACSGCLTADWRKENLNVEPAIALVVKINTKRSNKKSAPIEPLHQVSWPSLDVPETWMWVQFGSIIGELRNGVSLRPNIDPPGIPILRISAARAGSVNLLDVRYMPNGKDFLPLYAIRNDDLLFTRYNGSIELLGVCGRVVGLGNRLMIYPDKLMRVRFDHGFILPAYAEIFFQMPSVHERIVAKSKSSAGQNGVSGSDIKEQPFALPPFPEQEEIVRRVDGLFTLIAKIEARFDSAIIYADKLEQSILAKAFRGELVPSNTNDESADKLS